VACKEGWGETSLGELRALVAAAGRGSRSGLSYPKTLFPIQGKPILVRILELLTPFDCFPTVVVSPEGKGAIGRAIADHGLEARLVIQPVAKGMGDAVLQFARSPVYEEAETVLLIWGDIPFIQRDTVEAVLDAHAAHRSDFTFATRRVAVAYTRVERDRTSAVRAVIETKELSVGNPGAGERDIGLFAFRKDVVFDILRQELPEKWGRATGEHGFLYVVKYLADTGGKVIALTVASEQEVVSLNSMLDVQEYI
jgi:bifunctional UDP-N-acetylglucosamine pyrophosphorylase / glucosamine-1-phosphate N-acetyltransferase